MEKLPVLLKWLISSLVGAALAVWISIPMAIKSLLLFMGLDYATGVIVAAMNRKLSSDIGRRGIAKKVLVLILVGAAHAITRSLNLDYDLGSVVAVAYIVNELISIIENCDRAGVPIPAVLRQAVAKAKNLTEVNWDGRDRRENEGLDFKGPEKRGNGANKP